MKLFFILLFTSSIFASSYPDFSSEEIIEIKKSFGIKAQNRVLNYINNINYYKHLPREKQLSKVNLYLNQLLTKKDIQHHSNSDYWETPKEFLITGKGDCEDYAIIKYYTLLKLGFKKSRLYMTIVYEKYSKKYHMVLSYFKSRKQPPLILDNLSFRILNSEQREDLIFKNFINETGVYKLDDKFTLIKVDDAHPKLIDLIKRIDKEN